MTQTKGLEGIVATIPSKPLVCVMTIIPLFFPRNLKRFHFRIEKKTSTQESFPMLVPLYS